MSTNWKAGDRAVCVETFLPHPDFDNPAGAPVKGTVYLVTGLFMPGNELGLRLAGLPTFYRASGNEAAWDHAQFRKVVPACDREADSEQAHRAIGSHAPSGRVEDQLVPHPDFWKARTDL